MLDYEDFTSVETVSSSDQSKKSNKPLMEKRRRARINRSLAELKTILLETSKKSVAGHSKWEKADILEMTVQHLHSLMNQQKANQSDPLSVGQFIAGFSECVKQVQKSSDLDCNVKTVLQAHLLSYLKSFSSDATQSFNSCATKPPISAEMSPSVTCSSEDSNGDLTPPRNSPDQTKLDSSRFRSTRYRSNRYIDSVSPYANLAKSSITQSPILASRLSGITVPTVTQRLFNPSEKSNLVWRPWH